MTVCPGEPRSNELRQAMIDKLTVAGVILSGETMDGPWEAATDREAAMIADALLPDIEDHFRVEREDQDRRIEELEQDYRNLHVGYQRLVQEKHSLAAENEELRGSADAWRAEYDKQLSENTALAAENEELKTALLELATDEVNEGERRAEAEARAVAAEARAEKAEAEPPEAKLTRAAADLARTSAAPRGWRSLLGPLIDAAAAAQPREDEG